MHLSSPCRVTVFLILLVVFGLNLTFWVQDTGTRHCANVGHWEHLQWHSELTECSLHEFTGSDAVQCLHDKYISFIGDDNMRRLFMFFAMVVTGKNYESNDKGQLSVRDEVRDITMDYHQLNVVDNGVDQLYEQWKASNGPQLILHNGCSWMVSRRRTMSEVLSETKDDVSTEKLWGQARKNTNRHIVACNELIRYVYSGSPVEYMEPLTSLVYSKSPGGMDISVFWNLTLKAKLNVVLSSYCSPSLPDVKLSPRCCVSPQPSQWLLVVMVLGVAIYLGSSMIVATNTLKGLQPFIQASKQLGIIPLSDQRLHVVGQIISSVCQLTMIFLLIYVCDRTFLFTKSDKISSMLIFLLLLFCSVLGGLLTLTEPEEYGFFDDRQVDEFKGLSMLFILCYSYMAPAIQQRIFPDSIHQLSVGLYLFTTSYNCFVYSRHCKGFSLSKLLKRLAHINLFPIILSTLLKTSYPVYYLAPILSLSYLFMFLVISTHPKITNFSHSMSVIVIKLALLAVVIWFLPPIDSFVNSKQTPAWRAVYKLIDDNKFVPLFGMIVGFATCKAKDAELNVYKLQKGSRVAIRVVILIGSLLTLIYSTKLSHTNFSLIIFLALILLRNFHSSLQKYNSVFLQTAGFLSYELFLIHFHIWVAYHGSALLLVTPEIELVNFLLATSVLVVIGDYLNSATHSLLQPYCNWLL
ncbi:N-acetylneuraminate 9-O-acetyltransferase-like isoform X2 [Dysidea avara]|uniref:N-acetylneuraminate 9-O-acetyltransferase-like isoform X2 n=1 Tax=Dysidea avara TaxID=196820 RepID=UPI00331D5ECD